MPLPITRIEAAAVARFLSATLSHVDGKRLPHVSCLHRLAWAYGYSNWNAMRPAIEEFPDMARLSYSFSMGETGSRLFAIAGIAARTGELSFFVVSHDTSEPGMPALAVQLATAVGRAADFRGAQFEYTRPDPVAAPPAGDLSSAATTPVIATTANGDMTIMLWWISVMFSKPYGSHTAQDVRVRKTGFQNWAAYGERAPTDYFLQALTGVPRPIRRCLYVPVEPTPPWSGKPEGYLPRSVFEGGFDGETVDWNCGRDRMQAVRQAYLLNRAAGLSNLDIGDIADRYRGIEPDPNEEPEAEIYWMSDSYD